jgi:hypothetical protein
MPAAQPKLDEATRTKLKLILTQVRNNLMDAIIIADEKQLNVRHYLESAHNLVGTIRADIITGKES